LNSISSRSDSIWIAELERYATKDDFVALREEMAQASPIFAAIWRFTAAVGGHERRIGGLETRVTVLEHPRRRPSK
jgi:hypothetical protein